MANAPVINNQAQRRASIVNDTPAVFQFNPWISGSGRSRTPNYRISAVGYDAVKKYDPIVVKMAAKYKVDPNLVRAIMYIENSQGWYDAFDPSPNSIRPMNVDIGLFNELMPGGNINNAADNIEAGVKLIQRLGERIGRYPNGQQNEYFINGINLGSGPIELSAAI